MKWIRRGARQERSGDADILADVLRTDGHRFRPLRAPSTPPRRAAVRSRDDLVWPVDIGEDDGGAGPIAVALLNRYPTPDSPARLGEKRLQRSLHQAAYYGAVFTPDAQVR